MTTEIIDVQFPGGKRVDSRVGDFLIKTDQSLKHGGDASAPEPFALFLASIASCAGIFALGFCQKRELSTDGLALKMVCERDEKGIMITRMALHLTLPTGFPEKYRSGIVRAMELCTVKKHIMEAPQFIIELE
ncbi:MAG: OsmC family protein [Gammaproteobacteria bacterium]|nr:OsmC family protein [Gammaproteobacteria bacterium]HXK57487.1 OsmC family protein [Gammaproteobacteria bacterium]